VLEGRIAERVGSAPPDFVEELRLGYFRANPCAVADHASADILDYVTRGGGEDDSYPAARDLGIAQLGE
jgi:hypothetical protein